MLISRISGCKGSANRTKYQIYLSISEMQPNFKLRSRLKVVQGERKTKTSFEFFRAAAYLQAAKQIKISATDAKSRAESNLFEFCRDAKEEDKVKARENASFNKEGTKEKRRTTFAVRLFCGKGGIRTPGASQHGGFQDRCNRPLYHLSNA